MACGCATAPRRASRLEQEYRAEGRRRVFLDGPHDAHEHLGEAGAGRDLLEDHGLGVLQAPGAHDRRHVVGGEPHAQGNGEDVRQALTCLA